MRRRRWFARGVWTCSAILMMCGFGGGAALAAGPSAHIDDVQTGQDTVELTLTTSNLPASVSLDKARVRVLAGGEELDARLTPQGRETATKVQPRAVMLLLDTSGSMSSVDIAAAQKAARDYVSSLPSDVRAGLITFADKPHLVVPPTADRTAVRGGLSGLTPDGATALYDAVRLGVSTVDALPGAVQGRLVVLSDGVDSSSTATLGSATGSLTSKNVPADIVAFKYGANDKSSVRQLAAANHGKVLTVDGAQQLSAAFTAIARSFTERALVFADVPRHLAGKSAKVTVLITAGGVTLRAAHTVKFATPVVTPPAAASDSASSWLPDWSLQVWLLAGMTFCLVLLVTLVAFGLGRREDGRRSVVDQVNRYSAGRRPTAAEPREESSLARAAVGWTEGLLRARGWEERLAERLDLAGLRVKPAEWIVLTVCMAVATSALFIVVGMLVPLAIFLGVIFASAVSVAVVSVKISRRCAAFADQLPDVLQLVASSLQSGFSLPQALDAVVRDGTQPAAGEISRALAESRIGVELEHALDKVAIRMASEDLRWVVMAVRIQREVGGNLAEVLLNTVQTMRERSQVRRQVRALSAEGRLSAYVLLALPIAIGTFLFFQNPDYMRPLYTTFPGIVMIVCSVLAMALGTFWMSRLVKVEV